MIKIACKGAESLPLDAIEEFQGSLKKRSKADIEKIIVSIKKYGFSFPFFIWNGTGHNYCLDGHGRIQALAAVREAGEDLPLFPVIYVEAFDEAEAKQKLLRLNSRYGDITQEGFEEFIADIGVEFEELRIPEVDLDLLNEPKDKEKEKVEHKPGVQITFKTHDDLQRFLVVLNNEIGKYDGADYSIKSRRI
jgi:hypothetical protein